MKVASYLKEIGYIYIVPFVLYLINPFGIGFLFGYILILGLIAERKEIDSFLG